MIPHPSNKLTLTLTLTYNLKPILTLTLKP